jgi:polysaccharide biosynthesis/export protein
VYARILGSILSLTLASAGVCHAADTFTPRDERYVLHPGDTITVEYVYTPEYNATVLIQPDGFASLPFLGDAKLGGLTLAQVHQQLMAMASKRLHQPEIVVGLKDFEKPNYVVGGEVGSPGRYEIRGHITALRAIQIAGGFKPSAKSAQILLIRPINGVDAETKLIDLKKVTDKRRLNEDIELRAGDMLIVPKARLAKIEPYIQRVNAGLYLNPLGL